MTLVRGDGSPTLHYTDDPDTPVGLCGTGIVSRRIYVESDVGPFTLCGKCKAAAEKAAS